MTSQCKVMLARTQKCDVVYSVQARVVTFYNRLTAMTGVKVIRFYKVSRHIIVENSLGSCASLASHMASCSCCAVILQAYEGNCHL